MADYDLRHMNPKLRKVVIAVAILNLAYFGVEFAVALIIGWSRFLPIASIFSKTPRSIS
jgi:hypothetical protein